MIVKCDSDAVVFILHCSFTSVFCLRRECWRLKPSVLLILAMSEVMAVLCRTFADLPFGKSSWSDVFCSCKHPHVLLQIGASCLNVVLIAANTEVSENALVTKCQTYIHLILFNAVSFFAATTATTALSGLLYDAGKTLVADYTQSVTFLMSIYRTMFLTLDSLYYVWNQDTDYGLAMFGGDLRSGNAIVIKM